MTRLIPIIALTALTAASCQKESKPIDPATQPTTPIEKPVIVNPAVVTIASVTMLEDCPDADPVEAKEARAVTEPEGEMAEGKRDERYAEPCAQSTMQLAITGQGESSSKLKIVALRLVGPDGKTLDTLEARSPTIWKDNAYVPWDQMVLPKTDVKASYKVSIGNWSKVEKALGGSSYGRMYVVEADVEIAGVRGTIRSSKATREPVEMIET
jgi:hypothetical protein